MEGKAAERPAASLRASLGDRLAGLDPRRLLRVALLLALAELTAHNLYQLVVWVPRSLAQNDFRLYYGAARIGFRSGWNRIYDADFQRASVPTGWPGVAEWFPYLNPPPLAWLVAPLTALPAPLAYLPWVVLVAGCLLASALLLAPPGLFWRLLFAGSALGFLPTFVAVAYGQPAPLIGLAVAASCLLIERRREVAAGLVLSALVIKPQLAFLVPVALLAAGCWRAAAACTVASGLMAAVSLLSLGADGIHDYVALAARYVSDPYFERWSLIPWLGAGWGWYAGVLTVAAIAVVAARRARRRPGTVLAVGVVASLLANHYLTPADFTILLVPLWLLLREGRPAWFGAWLALLWVAGWFSLADAPEIVAAELVTLGLLALGAGAGAGLRRAAGPAGA